MRFRMTIAAGVGALTLAFGAAPASATGVQYSGGTLFIVGDNDVNDITVVDLGGKFEITDTSDPVTAIPPCALVDPNTAVCDRDPVELPPPAPPRPPIVELDVALAAANDSFTNLSDLSTDDDDEFGGTRGIRGGPGNDRLVGGPGNEWFFGDADDDEIDGGAGADHMFGGFETGFSGANEADAQGNDKLFGGPGDDTAHYEGAVTPLQITLDGEANDGLPNLGEKDEVRAENVLGGTAGDTIVGDAGANRLVGGDGPDLLQGRGGSDTLDGGVDDDTLQGGRGADQLTCGSGPLDLVLLRPTDTFTADCERTGARILNRGAADVTGGGVRIRLECPSGEAANCKGNVTLSAKGRRIGSERFDIPAGKEANVKLQVGRAERRVQVKAKTNEPVNHSIDKAHLVLVD